MPFVIISVHTPLGEYTFSAARRHSLLRAIQMLVEHELKRDFEEGVVTLEENADGPSEITAQGTLPREGRPLTPAEQALLTKLNELLGASGYQMEVNGDVIRADGTPVHGLGVDWRGVQKLVATKGEGILPGLIAQILDGAKEIERTRADGAQG